MSSGPSRRPLFYAYALLTGLLGGVAMTHSFAYQQQGISLSTVLMFTLVALVMSYITADVHIYLGTTASTQVRPEPEGMMLLGLTLVSGPAAGSWAALIVGLVAAVMSMPADRAKVSAARTFARVAVALLDGGRNIIAVVVAWLAYRGMGGDPSAILSNVYQATAMGVLCIVYSLVRHLWKMGAMLALGETVEQNVEAFLAELLPLIITPLIVVSYSHLGRQFFLLLSLVLIGAAALLRQMSTTLEKVRERVAVASFSNHIRRELDEAQDADEMCALAYQLCSQVVPAAKFELGLFSSVEGAITRVHVKVAVEEGERLPPMRLPLTPLWEWLSSLGAPLLADEERLASLPFELSPLGRDNRPVRSAIFAPIPYAAHAEVDDAPAAPLGAMVLLSTHQGALNDGHVGRVAIIAGQLGEALSGLATALREGRDTAEGKDG